MQYYTIERNKGSIHFEFFERTGIYDQIRDKGVENKKMANQQTERKAINSVHCHLFPTLQLY